MMRYIYVRTYIKHIMQNDSGWWKKLLWKKTMQIFEKIPPANLDVNNNRKINPYTLLHLRAVKRRQFPAFRFVSGLNDLTHRISSSHIGLEVLDKFQDFYVLQNHRRCYEFWDCISTQNEFPEFKRNSLTKIEWQFISRLFSGFWTFLHDETSSFVINSVSPTFHHFIKFSDFDWNALITIFFSSSP